jgi:signal transduction histidine kinase
LKRDKIQIKWKIFGYLCVFSAVMIILLWLFQIVFLESFYKAIKTQAIKSSAESITRNIDNEDITTLIDRIAEQNSMCIRMVTVADTNFTDLHSVDVMPDCVIHKMPLDKTYALYEQASRNGGTAFELLSRQNFKNGPYNNKHFIGKVPTLPPPDKDMMQSMIYVKLAAKADGSTVMIMLNSTITPVNTTVDTLRVQFIYITIILVILSIILALFMSKKISKPIIKITHSAKKLAKGNYDISFEGSGYLEIVELNDTLNYAAKELSKVESLRRELIANISHDLRTPLTMITGYAEVMRDLPGENTPENVQIIIDEAKRLTTLVNDILDISKLQSGTQKVVLSDFNITESIRDIIKRYATLTKLDGYHIDFVFDEDVYVTADEVQISQVIYNLINNAITYTGPDKSIKVYQEHLDGFVKVRICDTGIGIPEDKLPYIWDRYYKVDKAHKRAAIGTGLGLSIVKGILDMHHAAYGVISHEGQGSVFWFELKIK